MKLFRFSSFVFLICFEFLISNFVFRVTPVAAQQVSLSVSPPVVEIILAPGKSVTQTFTLETQGEDISVTPELHLAKPSDGNGHVVVDPAPLDQSTIPLIIKLTGPNSSPTITFTAVATDVAEDVYLALVFHTSPLESSVSNLTSTSPAISALILVTINPTGVIPINLEIKDFSPPLIHDSWGPLATSATIFNSTPIMIRTIGTYEIISPTGKTILSLPLYPNLVLGNSSRSIMGFHSRSEGSPHSGSVDAASDPTPLSWQPKWSNLGPYRLRLVVTTQGGTKITEVEKVVWLFPIKITLLLILITIFIWVLLLRHKRLTPTV